MKKSDADLAERLRAHYEILQKHYPGEVVTPEFDTLILYFLEKNDGVDDQDRVYSARKFLRGIQDYIDALKKETPDRHIDIDMMDILDCVKRNLKQKGVEYCVEIAVIMQRNIECFGKLRPDVNVDYLIRTVFCYMAQTQPRLIPGRAVVVAESLMQKLGPYLKAGTKNKHTLSTDHLKYYLWVASEYPGMTLRTASRWAESIAQTKTYRCVQQVFTPKFPFSYLSFSSFTDGTANFIIGAKTKLGAPKIHFLQNIPNSRLVYNDMAIMLEFDLSKTDTPQFFVATVELFLHTIERVLIPGVKDPTLFHDKKWEFIWAASAHCKNFSSGFRGLKSLQFQPPREDEEERFPLIGRKMREAVYELDFLTIEQMLRRGLDANFRHWGDSMLEMLIHVPHYSVKLTGGEPTAKQLEELYKLHEERRKHPTNPYSVVISKAFGFYRLYWCVEMPKEGEIIRFIVNEPIEGVEDIQFLNTIPDNKWRENDGFRTCDWVSHISRIQDLVIPYLRTTVERKRKDHVAMILKIAAVLMEYGADPSYRREPVHTGSRTVVERLLDDSKEMTNLDELGQGLLIDMLKLLLSADRKRSHMHVGGNNDQHFMGQFILKVRPALKKAAKIAPQIQSVSLQNSFIGHFLEVTNFKLRNVFICTLPLSEFREEQQIVDLCKRSFPSLSNMTDEDFSAYIKKKLKPGRDIGMIDLVYGNNGEIIAFNIARIVIPRKAERPVLHYIPLASSEKLIQTEFRELMSQISFQRIVFLKQRFGKEVLTFYTAASAMSYLQVAKLPQVYPKHNCLDPEDLKYVCEEFFADREIVEDRGVLYYSSVLFYHAPPKEKDLLDESDINYRGFSTRIEKEGLCPLVGFYATRANLKKLGQKIGSQLANGLTFFSIAADSTKLNESAFRITSSM